MMWKFHGALLGLLMTTSMSAGKLLPEEKVESRALGETRTVRVHLPPSYDRANSELGLPTAMPRSDYSALTLSISG